jgi:hypothetical protein
MCTADAGINALNHHNDSIPYVRYMLLLLMDKKIGPERSVTCLMLKS